MLNTSNQCRDFARHLASESRKGSQERRELLESVAQLRRSGTIEENFDMRALFEELVPDGREAVRMMESNRGGRGQTFVEAGGDAITTADFSNVMGQITYGDVLDAFDTPELIAGQLMRERPAMTAQQEIIPGVSMIGDKAQAIGENENYPMVGLNEQWIVTPAKIKTGFMMSVTEEAIVENLGPQILENMQKASLWLAINQEKERLNTILGITTSFRWMNNAAQATYADSHTGFTLDNLIASNGLVDYTDLDAVKNAFNDVVDPTTGELVFMSGELQLVVPDPLETTAARIINSIETRQTANSIETITAGSPIQYGRRRWSNPIANQYVSSITSSDTTWFAGKFKEAFEDRVIWPLGMFVEDRNSSKLFERDWVTRLKVRRKSAPTVRAPWKVMKCTA